jgi:enoyl-CoA hydratase/carnithine racemase
MVAVPTGLGKSVLYEKRDDHVGVITLNRPEVRNAVNGEITEALAYLVRETESDADIRVIVLASSHDSVFCAGADLGEISRGNVAGLMTAEGGFAGIVRARRAKPWIAAVRGAALAGGCEIMLSCDMIVASTDARFGLPEVKRGLYAGAGGPYRLMHALPRAVALELIATGDPLDAGRAYALGMVNRLVAPDMVLGEALALASTITANAPMSVRESIAVARETADKEEAAFWALSAVVRDRVHASQDAKEGARAFLEKRVPHWVGH